MNVVYHKLVQKDLDDAWGYYEDASEGLGDRFFDEFLAVIASIQRNPKSWPPTDKGRRVALFSRFPYQLLYRIEPERVKVLVVCPPTCNPACGEQRR